jgi:hypothetical protein
MHASRSLGYNVRSSETGLAVDLTPVAQGSMYSTFLGPRDDSLVPIVAKAEVPTINATVPAYTQFNRLRVKVCDQNDRSLNQAWLR